MAVKKAEAIQQTFFERKISSDLIIERFEKENLAAVTEEIERRIVKTLKRRITTEQFIECFALISTYLNHYFESGKKATLSSERFLAFAETLLLRMRAAKLRTEADIMDMEMSFCSGLHAVGKHDYFMATIYFQTHLNKSDHSKLTPNFRTYNWLSILYTKLGSHERAKKVIESRLQSPKESDFTRTEILILKAKRHILSGEIEDCLDFLSNEADTFHSSSKKTLEFLLALSKAIASKDPGLLAQFCRHERDLDPVQLAEGKLFLLAVQETRWSDFLPKSATISRKAGEASHQANRLDRVLVNVSDLYHSDIPLEKRIDTALNVVERSLAFYKLEHQLLALAAVARWALRSKQTLLFDEVYALYQSSCLTASSQKTSDIYRLFL